MSCSIDSLILPKWLTSAKHDRHFRVCVFLGYAEKFALKVGIWVKHNVISLFVQKAFSVDMGLKNLNSTLLRYRNNPENTS